MYIATTHAWQNDKTAEKVSLAFCSQGYAVDQLCTLLCELTKCVNCCTAGRDTYVTHLQYSCQGFMATYINKPCPQAIALGFSWFTAINLWQLYECKYLFPSRSIQILPILKWAFSHKTSPSFHLLSTQLVFNIPHLYTKMRRDQLGLP